MDILRKTEKDRIFYKTDIIDAVLSKRGITLEAAAHDWQTDPKLPTNPSRASLYRWYRTGFPGFIKGGPVYRMLEFCALLDIDPLAVFDYQLNGFFSRFAKLRKTLNAGFGKLGAFTPLYELFYSDDEWPSDVLAKKYWGKRWALTDFDNLQKIEKDENSYINVRFTEPCAGLPRAIHLAFRRIRTKDVNPLWSYYGTVTAFEDLVCLYSTSGDHAKMARADEQTLMFCVNFGQQPMEFRLASLHGFTMEEIHNSSTKQGLVGFEV